MAKKNHHLIDGKLLQTDKKFASLKGSQQSKIHEWLLECYLNEIKRSPHPLTKTQKESIVDAVYTKIEDSGIWIPYHEVRGYFSGKLVGWNKKHLTKGGEPHG